MADAPAASQASTSRKGSSSSSSSSSSSVTTPTGSASASAARVSDSGVMDSEGDVNVGEEKEISNKDVDFQSASSHDKDDWYGYRPLIESLIPQLNLLFFPFVSILTVAMYEIGFPVPFTSIFVGILGFLYLHTKELTLPNIMKLILFGIVKLFFRDIGHRGTHKIEQLKGKGAVLFVCAPHANQFLDPILVMKTSGHTVGFLAAAKSMRRKWVGKFGRALNSIPVERPQDLAKPGPGTITGEKNKIIGSGTQFKNDVKGGYQIVIKGESYQVASVEDDTNLTLSASLPAEVVVNASKYQVAPKVNQDAVFESVWKALSSGQSVGIFPEGGSHDRSDLLPLKAGVTLMAMGAQSKYPETKVYLIPTGLNYFAGHRFRSRAYVDYGDPIVIPEEIQKKYNAGGAAKREACNELLDLIYKGLKAVTVTAPDYETLQTMWAVRRLYKPKGVELGTQQKMELSRRLVSAYEKMKDSPKVAGLIASVKEYNESLRNFGIRDHEVERMGPRWVAWPRLLYRALLLLSYGLFAFPGFVLNGPVIVVSRTISKQKAAEAVAASSVKLEGRDVLGTWKIMTMITLLPLCFIIYPALAALIGYLMGWGALHTWSYFALLQPFIMYGSVRATEKGLEILRTLPALFVAAKSSSAAESLKKKRIELSQQIRNLIDEVGPQLFGGKEQFEEFRIIKSDQMPANNTTNEENKS